MTPTSLFPDEIETDPVSHPGPPLLWLRRLVIVRERSVGGEVIRDIPFRLGLNIIDTPESPAGETRTVGHNVGKTLLVRLIRYCLGDRNFINRSVRFQFQNRFPNAYVLAEAVVANSRWTIARPFAKGKPSWSISGGVCEDLLGDPSLFSTYDEFNRALEAATVARFSTVTLPHVARKPVWTDLLGWLARDQRCRFRHHNEWREPDMDAGPPSLKIEDANLLTRLVMGILDPQEQELALRVDELQQERNQVAEKRDGLEQSFRYTRAHLMRTLGLTSEAPIGRLFATRVREGLSNLNDELQAERERVVAQADLEQFEAARLRAERDVGVAEGQAFQMEAQKDFLEAQLTQAQAGNRTSMQVSLLQQLKCDLPECPLGKTDRPPGTSDPILVARIADLRDDLVRIETECLAQAQQVDALREAERTAAETLRRRRDAFNASLARIHAKAGEFRLLGVQVDEYETDVSTYEAATEQCERLDASIESAKNDRKGILEQHAGRFSQLDDYFRQAIRQLLPDANGSLELNNKVGLSPRTDDATGEAIGTAGKVVGFDLTCLLATIAGLGQHPRFLIHDSPREADLERTAYYRLFQWALNLEQTIPGDAPFQYILTTTTPPPPALACAPYVCLTLDARQPDGLLLKERF